ncbi:hypothetical protein SZ64_08665 [Erythrobacter sp. SG61-1L]|uniref:hypothetical protein n=1 Tax=Erythrobacter sp. SG61-1L TaxID=1603897 RepID=UPI0006C906B1|nr:hypothetical protein [Erythrobacter sp. SG61-1L]KPL68185.1 hypothetical protein SZ64_08665 [Erythrobacter sp. SG61-1L]
MMAFAVLGSLLATSAATAEDVPLTKRSVEQLDRECDAKQAESCDELRFRYTGIRGVAKDDAKSAAYRLRGCEAGDARACGVYAVQVNMNKPGYPAKNPAIVARYAYLGCVGGDAPTCGFASALANKTTSYNAQERATIYDKVCSIGTPADCALAADAEGGRASWRSAADYARRACARGDSRACINEKAFAARDQNSRPAVAARPSQPTQQAARKQAPLSDAQRYQPSTGRRSNARDQSRSGYESCTKSNGASGSRYWYYGFDNKRQYGPCT